MVRIVPSNAFRPAFTFVEVLIATAVLAMISTGFLATTWRLAAFAREEAEHMVADSYCHDVMWAVYSQEYKNIKTIDDEWEIPVNSLPRIERVNLLGEKKEPVYPLWRIAGKPPKCQVHVEEVAGNTAEEDSKRITVKVKWYNGTVSDPQWHSNVVMRSRIEREAE